MSRKLRLCLAMGIALSISCVSLFPWEWKVAAGIGLRYLAIDLVPFPWLARIFGPVITVNPHAMGHVLAYGGATLLLLLLFRARWTRILLCIALATLALATEQAEHKIYGNKFEWNDLRLDLYSIVSVMALASVCAIRKPSPFRPVSRLDGAAAPEASDCLKSFPEAAA